MQESTAVVYHKDVQYPTQDLDSTEEEEYSLRKNFVSKISLEGQDSVAEEKYSLRKNVENDIVSENEDLNRNDSNYVIGSRDLITNRLRCNDSQCNDLFDADANDKFRMECVENLTSEKLEKCNHQLIKMDEARSCTDTASRPSSTIINLEVSYQSSISIGNESCNKSHHSKTDNCELLKLDSLSTELSSVVDTFNTATLARTVSDGFKTVRCSAPMPIIASESNVSNIISHLTVAVVDNASSLFSATSAPNSSEKTLLAENSCELAVKPILKTETLSSFNYNNPLLLTDEMECFSLHPTNVKFDSRISESNVSDVDCVMDLRCEPTNAQSSCVLSSVENEIISSNSKTINSNSSIVCTDALPDFTSSNKTSLCNRSYATGKTKDLKTRRLDSVVKDLSMRADDRNNICGLTMTAAVNTCGYDSLPVCHGTMSVSSHQDLANQQKSDPIFIKELADGRNYSSLSCEPIVSLMKLRDNQRSAAVLSVSESESVNRPIDKRQSGQMYNMTKDEAYLSKAVVGYSDNTSRHLHRRSRAKQHNDRFVDDCSQIKCHPIWGDASSSSVSSKITFDDNHALNLSMTAVSTDIEAALNLTSDRSRTTNSSACNDQGLTFPGGCYINSPFCEPIDSTALKKPCVKRNKASAVYLDEGMSSKRSNLMSFNDVFLNHLKKADDNSVCVDDAVTGIAVFPASTVRPIVPSMPYFHNPEVVESDNPESLRISSTDLSCSQNMITEVSKIKDVTKGPRKKRVSSEFVAELMLSASRSNRGREIFDSGVPDTTFAMPHDIPLVVPDQTFRLNSINLITPLEVPILSPEVEQSLATISVKGGGRRKKKHAIKKTKEVAINLSVENQCVQENSIVTNTLSPSSDLLSVNRNVVMDDSHLVLQDVIPDPIKPTKSRARNSKDELKKMIGVRTDGNTDGNNVSDKDISPDVCDFSSRNSSKVLELESSKNEIDILDNAKEKILDVSSQNIEVDAIATHVEQLVLCSKKATVSRSKKRKVKQKDILPVNLTSDDQCQTKAIPDNTCTTKIKLSKKRKYSLMKATTLNDSQSDVDEFRQDSQTGENKTLAICQNVCVEESNTQQLSSVLDFKTSVIATDQCSSKVTDDTGESVKLTKQKQKRKSKCAITDNVKDPVVVTSEETICVSKLSESTDNNHREVSTKKSMSKRKKKMTDSCAVSIAEVIPKLSEPLIAEPKIKKTKVSKRNKKKMSDLNELPSEVVSTTVELVLQESKCLNPLRQDSNETISNEHCRISVEPSVGSVTDLKPVSLPKFTKRKQKAKTKTSSCSETPVDQAGVFVNHQVLLKPDLDAQPILDTEHIKLNEQLTLLPVTSPKLTKRKQKAKSKKATCSETRVDPPGVFADQQALLNSGLDVQPILDTELMKLKEKLESLPVTSPKLTKRKQKAKSKKATCSETLVDPPGVFADQQALLNSCLDVQPILDTELMKLKEKLESLPVTSPTLTKRKQKTKFKKTVCYEVPVDQPGVFVDQQVLLNSDLHVQPILDTERIKSNEQLASEHQGDSLLVQQAAFISPQSEIDIEQKKSKATTKRKSKKQLALEKQINTVSLHANEKVVVCPELVVLSSSNFESENLNAENKSKTLQSSTSAVVSKPTLVQINEDVSTDLRCLGGEYSQNLECPESQFKPAKRPKVTKKRKSKKDGLIPSSASFKVDSEKVQEDEESNRRVMETLDKVASGENPIEIISTNESLNISSSCNIDTKNHHETKIDGSVITTLTSLSVEENIQSNIARTGFETECSFVNVINDVAKCPELFDGDQLVGDRHDEGDRPFVCPRCRYTARKKGQLRKHLGVHGIYACAHCAFTSDGHVGLDEHMKDNHPSRCGRRLCKRCHVLFGLDLIDTHEVECTGVKRGWDCSVCGKRFKFVSAMRTHVRRWHGSSTPIVDINDGNPECNESTTPALPSVVFNEKDADSNYRNKSEGVKSSPERSDIVKKKKKKSEAVEGSRADEKSVKLHLKESVDRPIKCSSCSRSFKRQQSLEKHVSLKHEKFIETLSDNLNLTKCKPGEEPILQSSSVISYVTNSHASIVPSLSTDDAGAIEFTTTSISEIDSLEIKKTADERPVGETSDSNIKQSVLPVSAERFYCTAMACGKEFRKLKQLHRHAEKHVGEEKPYRCDWTGCRKTFIFAENLTYHRQQHTDPKPFPCLQCSAGYWQKCSLRVHQRRMHKVATLDQKNCTTRIKEDQTEVKVTLDDESTEDIDEPLIAVKEQSSDIKDTPVNDLLCNDIKDTPVNDLLCKEESNINVSAKVESIEHGAVEDIKLEPKKRLPRQKVKRGGVKARKALVQKNRPSKINKEISLDPIISSEVLPVTADYKQMQTKTEVELLESSKQTKTKKVRVKKERSKIRGSQSKRMSDVKLSLASSEHDSCIDKISKERLENCVLSKKKRSKNICLKSEQTCSNEESSVASGESVKVKTSVVHADVLSNDFNETKPKMKSKEISIYEFCEDEDHNVELLKSVRRSSATGIKEVILKPTSLVQDTIEVIKKPPVSLKTYLKPRNKNSTLENKPNIGSDSKPIVSDSSDIIPASVIPVPKAAITCGTKRKLDTVDDSSDKGKSQARNKRSPKKFSGHSVSSYTEKRKLNASTSDTDDETADERNVPSKKKLSKKVDVNAVAGSATKTVRKRRKLEIENVNIICEGTVRMTMIEAQIRITEMSRDGSRKNPRKNSKNSKVSDVVATFPQIEFTAKTNKYKRGNISKIKIKGCRKRGSSSKSKRKPPRKQTSSFEVIDVSCKKTPNKSQNKSKSVSQQKLSKSSKSVTTAREENAEIDLGEEPCVELSIVEAVSRIAKKRSEQLLKPVIFDESSSESSESEERLEDEKTGEQKEAIIEDITGRDSSENDAQNVESSVNPVATEEIKIDNVILSRDESMIADEDALSADIPFSSHFSDIDLVQSDNRSELDCTNTAVTNDYDRHLKETRPLSPTDLLPMEDISPHNLENLSVPSTGSPYSSERDDDDIPTTPPPLLRQASTSSMDSLDSKEPLMSRECQTACETRQDEDDDVSELNSYQAVPVITATSHQSQQQDDHNEGHETTTTAEMQSRNYGDENQRLDGVREQMDHNPGRYEASLDNYAENQVLYREHSHSPHNSHQQDMPDNVSRNAVNFVYHDSIPSSAYTERQYTHRSERNPLQSLEGLAAGTVTGSPGGPSGGYFDQTLSPEETGGKQAVYIQPHHRSSYSMTSPNESYLTDLGPPPSVGHVVPTPITHPTTSIDPTVASRGQQGQPTSHTNTPSGHEILPTHHPAPPTSHVAPPTPVHSAVPPTGHPVEYGRVSDPRFMIQRSPPENPALSRTVSHAAVPGFPSDSFAKDFFGQYFQDPTSHLNALGSTAAGQDQRSLGGYMGQQLPGGFSRAQADLFRCTPSALISNSPYPSIPESFLGMKPPPPGVMSQSAQGQGHWSSVGEERSRPWSNQTPSMLEMESGPRNSYSKLDYASEAMSLSSHSSKRGVPGGNTPSDLMMFPGASSSSLPPPPGVQSTDKYGIPSAYSTLAHAYSPTGAAPPAGGGGYSSRGLAGASSTSQKHFEDAYRHAAAAQLNDYRTLAAAQAQHASMPPDVYMAGINPSSLAGFDRYYYASARDAMYRSHHLAASAMPHHFMQQSGASQQVYGDRGATASVGYGREGMYTQPSPYSFIGGGGSGGGGGNGEKQYLSGSSGKGSTSHGGPSIAHSDYLPPNSTVDVQDPYRRSVIYNMMTPRYF